MPATFNQPHGYMVGMHGSEQFHVQDNPPFMMPMQAFPGYMPGHPSAGIPVSHSQTNPYDPNRRDINEFMYQVGFIQGRFSDVRLHAPTLQHTFPLHALFLARSPALARLLKSAEGVKSPTFTLPLSGKISSGALLTILGHLYRPLSHHSLFNAIYKNPILVMEYLELCMILELEDVENMVLDIVSNDTNPDHNLAWFHSLPDSHPSLHPRLLNHLIHTLPRQWDAFGHNIREGYYLLARVYALLPLDALRQCIEHDELPAIDAMQRFNFAKQVIRLRGNESVSVALSFDGGDVSVKVVKNSKRRKSGGWDPSAYST